MNEPEFETSKVAPTGPVGEGIQQNQTASNTTVRAERSYLLRYRTSQARDLRTSKVAPTGPVGDRVYNDPSASSKAVRDERSYLSMSTTTSPGLL